MLNHVESEYPQLSGLKIKETRQAIQISLAFLLVVLVAKYFCDQTVTAPHRSLVEKRIGSNSILYYQNGKPTPDELREGQFALDHWKSASRRERNRYADELIQSGVLTGMTPIQIAERMGVPDNLSAGENISPQLERIRYDCTVGMADDDLIIDLKNKGKANLCYLEITW